MSTRWIADVHVDPNVSDLPGGAQLQQILDGLAGWALLAALAGMLISAIMWALGSFGGNHWQVSKGKIGVLVCAAAALIAGGAAQIINFFADLGSHIH